MKHIEEALKKSGKTSGAQPVPRPKDVPQPYAVPAVPAMASPAPQTAASPKAVPQQPPIQPVASQPVTSAATPAYAAAQAAPVTDLPRNIRPQQTLASSNPNWLNTLPPIECDFDSFFKRHYGAGANSDYLRTAYGILRTNILQKAKAKNARKIGITSASANAGKTVTSIHLALAAARRQEYDVILVDFDLRSPSIGKYIGAQNYKTVADYFREENSIRDYLYRSDDKSLNVIMNDTRIDFSAEYLAGQRTDDALNDLVNISDKTIVFFDLPPLLGCDDTVAFLPKLDGVVLVTASEETQTSHLNDAIDMLADSDIYSTVLNKHDGLTKSYQYY